MNKMNILKDFIKQIEIAESNANSEERSNRAFKADMNYSYGYYRGKREAYDNVLFLIERYNEGEVITKEELENVLR